VAKSTAARKLCPIIRETNMVSRSKRTKIYLDIFVLVVKHPKLFRLNILFSNTSIGLLVSKESKILLKRKTMKNKLVKTKKKSKKKTKKKVKKKFKYIT